MKSYTGVLTARQNKRYSLLKNQVTERRIEAGAIEENGKSQLAYAKCRQAGSESHPETVEAMTVKQIMLNSFLLIQAPGAIWGLHKAEAMFVSPKSTMSNPQAEEGYVKTTAGRA